MKRGTDGHRLDVFSTGKEEKTNMTGTPKEKKPTSLLEFSKYLWRERNNRKMEKCYPSFIFYKTIFSVPSSLHKFLLKHLFIFVVSDTHNCQLEKEMRKAYKNVL